MSQDSPYCYVIVESYVPKSTSGLHGEVHIRPAKGEQFSQDLQVQCSKELSQNYPVGTKFRIKAKLTDREGGGEYLYSSYKWKYEVFSDSSG